MHVIKELIQKPSNQCGELLRKFNDYKNYSKVRKFVKCDLICRNYCILLKISKELSCKIF
ncbi:hypothetical protein B0192_11040 [Leptospira interrogans serovar Australis]|nr:hypothetical protein B0192_11040 [Leptospira interrogans serovar Australis]